MLKTILEKAIGEDKQFACNQTHTKANSCNVSVCYNCSSAGGYNEAKAEMRAKIPQVIEEVVKIINEAIREAPIEVKMSKLASEVIPKLIKSLTENK